MRISEGGGNDLRKNRRHNAVQIRRARSQPDQREHVGTAIYERSPEALKKRPSAPQHNGSGKDEVDPIARRRRERKPKPLPKHPEHPHPPPTPPTHPTSPPPAVIFRIH